MFLNKFGLSLNLFFKRKELTSAWAKTQPAHPAAQPVRPPPLLLPAAPCSPGPRVSGSTLSSSPRRPLLCPRRPRTATARCCSSEPRHLAAQRGLALHRPVAVPSRAPSRSLYRAGIGPTPRLPSSRTARSQDMSWTSSNTTRHPPHCSSPSSSALSSLPLCASLVSPSSELTYAQCAHAEHAAHLSSLGCTFSLRRQQPISSLSSHSLKHAKSSTTSQAPPASHLLSPCMHTCTLTPLEHTQHTLINSLSVGGYSKHRHACFNSHSLHTHAHTLRQQRCIPFPCSPLSSTTTTRHSLAILLQ